MWLVVGVLWAGTFGWKTAVGDLNDVQYLLYYSILRALEGVTCIGGLYAIAPSTWVLLIPDWLLARLCCKPPPPAPGRSQMRSGLSASSRSSRARARPSRGISLSSDIAARSWRRSEATPPDARRSTRGMTKPLRTATRQIVNPLKSAEASM